MDFSITLADRRAPWEAASWADGQKPTSEKFATASEMLDAAGLAGWNVQAQPLVTTGGIPVPGKFAQVAEDGRVLGLTGRTYKTLQNETAFAFGDSIVDAGGANWERAGMFRNGSVVFGAMELCHLDITVPGDDSQIKPYLLIVNSFDGGYPYMGILAYIRPVCTNTFEAAVGTQTQYRFAIRHSGTLDGKLAMAREALGIAFKHNEEVAALVTKLATTSIVDKQVQKIFEKVVWPVDMDSLSEGRVENHPATVAFQDYLTSPTIDGIRGTAWGAFNAVTEYIDHIQEFKGGTLTSAADTKGNSILFGAGQQRKDAAIKALLKV
jgi:phage/plasmid-like protein (TIGR03299 family)